MHVDHVVVVVAVLLLLLVTTTPHGSYVDAGSDADAGDGPREFPYSVPGRGVRTRRSGA
jgi:hypothetical protein